MLLAGALLWPEPYAIRAGQDLSGVLEQGDRVEPDGSYFDVFALQGRQGRACRLR